MKCPFCFTEYHDKPKVYLEFLEPKNRNLPDSDNGIKRLEIKDFFTCYIIQNHCPACGMTNLSLRKFDKSALEQPLTVAYAGPADRKEEKFLDETKFIYPHASLRPPCAKEVPSDLAEDYNQASLILNDSPKASAALSRRCLQNLLRQYANVKPQELSKEIQEILDQKRLSTPILQSLDAVRNIGNFAAHPNKSTSTGEILSVEPGETEWCLDVLESLFDHYFVQPAIIEKKRSELNKKLLDSGRPPMK
jgi:hypothetical protein